MAQVQTHTFTTNNKDRPEVKKLHVGPYCSAISLLQKLTYCLTNAKKPCQRQYLRFSFYEPHLLYNATP